MNSIAEKTIFVSIPAFNEMFLDRTIEDLFEKADNPNRIFVGVFNQKTTDKQFEDLSKFKNVRFVNAACDIPLGVCLARLNASMLYDGEDYFFQIDAHNFFIKGWDSVLIQNYIDLQELGIEKPLISQSVLWHTIDAYSSREYQDNLKAETAYPLTLNERGDTTISQLEVSDKFIYGRFTEHHLVMGPFMFTGGAFVNEVSYDFRITYIPDQESTAVRAWTRGYRIFCTGSIVVSTLTKMKVDNDLIVFDEENFSDDFKMNLKDDSRDKYQSVERHSFSTNSFYAILRGEMLGWFGSPDKQSIESYLSESGFDFGGFRQWNAGEKANLPDYLTKSIY